MWSSNASNPANCGAKAHGSAPDLSGMELSGVQVDYGKASSSPKLSCKNKFYYTQYMYRYTYSIFLQVNAIFNTYQAQNCLDGTAILNVGRRQASYSGDEEAEDIQSPPTKAINS